MNNKNLFYKLAKGFKDFLAIVRAKGENHLPCKELFLHLFPKLKKTIYKNKSRVIKELKFADRIMGNKGLKISPRHKNIDKILELYYNKKKRRIYDIFRKL